MTLVTTQSRKRSMLRATKPGFPLLSLTGKTLLRIPLSSRVLSRLSPGYSVRCLLFHDIADCTSVFTEGLGVTLNRKDFEARIRFIVKYYTPVRLQELLADSWEVKSGKPRVLVTFDDAYASVAQVAAPILCQYGVPAVMFVTGSVVGNQLLGLDNLLCYVVNRFGLEIVRSVASEITRRQDLKVMCIKQVIHDFLPTLSQAYVAELRAALVSTIGIRVEAIARKAQIYLSVEQLRSLVASGFEIGNHTLSHVFCRSLSGSEFHHEIDANKTSLESLTGTEVRAFSVPYGSWKDLTPGLEVHLRRSGHDAAFLQEGRMNTLATNRYHLDRVSVGHCSEADFLSRVEMLPRLRSLGDLWCEHAANAVRRFRDP